MKNKKNIRPSVKDSLSQKRTKSNTRASIRSNSSFKNKHTDNNKNFKKINNKRPSIKKQKNTLKSKTKSVAQNKTSKSYQNAKVLSKSISKKPINKNNNNWLKKFFNNHKKKFFIALIAILLIIIGISIAIFVYISTTESKLSLDNNTNSVLIKEQNNQPFYALFSADISEVEDGISDILLLAKVDKQNKHIIILAIPMETYVSVASGGGTTLKNICDSKNDSELINAVSTFTEFSISYYFKLNTEGLEYLIDTFGGIDVELKEQLDDPNNTSYIPSGNSTLNGHDALSLLRSKNFKGGQNTVLSNQLNIGKSLTYKAVNYNPDNIPFLIDQIAGKLKTNMKIIDCINFCKDLKNLDSNSIQQAIIPGYKSTRKNESVYIIDSSELMQLKQNIQNGIIPKENSIKTINDINPSLYTIYVRNGAGIDGAGSMVADKLSSNGFKISKTDNAEMSTYEETLIIYKGDALKDVAEAVSSTLENGRLVNGDGLYNMTTDIIVIIGGDYKIK